MTPEERKSIEEDIELVRQDIEREYAASDASRRAGRRRLLKENADLKAADYEALATNAEVVRLTEELAQALAEIAGLQYTLDFCAKDHEAILAQRDRALAVVEAPIPMILHCVVCNEQHVDRDEWATRPHKTHWCEHCGTEWRPSLRPTVGVETLAAFDAAEGNG